MYFQDSGFVLQPDQNNRELGMFNKSEEVVSCIKQDFQDWRSSESLTARDD